MNKRKKILIFLFMIVLVIFSFAGCKNKSATSDSATEATSEGKTSNGIVEVEYTKIDMGKTWNESEATKVDLSKTYEITKEGVYVFSGTLEDGQIIVDVKDTEKVQIVLNNANIICKHGPGIMVENADKVFITLAEETENSVSDGSNYISTEDQPWAAIFSRDDLTINGNGKLTVNGNFKNGIVSKDDLKITGGTINVTAANNGIKGTDSVGICGGEVTVSAKNDGIKSSNITDDGKGYISIDGGIIKIENVESQGIQASTIAQITDGTVEIISKNEGIQGKIVYIKGGKTDISSNNDGINATDDSSQSMMDAGQESVYIEIAGGKVNITASGDGLDSNGELIVSGGNAIIMGPENGGDSSLDYQSKGTITGGTIIALGASQMATNFGDDSKQASLMYNEGSGASGTEVTLTDSEGKEIVSVDATVSFSSVVISTPEMVTGKTYTLKIGNSSNEIEMSSTITNIGNSGMGGGRFDSGHGRMNPNNVPPDEVPTAPQGGF